MSEFQVMIHDVALGGRGVGRLPDGKVVFVPYTLAGETVRIRLGKSRKGFAEAQLLEVVIPSPHRVPPPCPCFARCGGCQYQHAAYEEQLRIKQKQVRDTLERIGGFQRLPSIHLEAAPSPLGYRNQISVHSGPARELGFFADDKRTVVDVERCLIANESVNAQLASLRSASFRPRHALLADASERGDSPKGSFSQVNAAISSALVRWVRQRVEGSPDAQFLDLYCGSGFFTLALAGVFAGVCGVDRDERAIHAAIARATADGVRNARFFAAPVEERLEWLLEDVPPDKTTILVDPPREGLHPSVIRLFARRPCVRLIHVSCDPATLARDLKRLAEAVAGRYVFSELGIFDMFPQTAHIETVAVLQWL
ncbi:MAG: class I SAM-dependent RNA methyltransferase [Verrucomicrobia bacterium]|nr:class I SAM-dependent RNA methyltransferase [Verrucomicrobiota bacterium]